MTETEQRRAAGLPGWRQLRKVVLRFGKFVGASVVSTAISQLTLMGVYGLGGLDATLSGVCAFVAGAVPNFLINRRWAWRRSGRPEFVREVLPYLAVIVTGGLLSTGLITLADHWLQPVLANRGFRTLALDGVYVASYGLLFVVKFVVLDRVVFRGEPGEDLPDGGATNPGTSET